MILEGEAPAEPHPAPGAPLPTLAILLCLLCVPSSSAGNSFPISHSWPFRLAQPNRMMHSGRTSRDAGVFKVG